MVVQEINHEYLHNLTLTHIIKVIRKEKYGRKAQLNDKYYLVG